MANSNESNVTLVTYIFAAITCSLAARGIKLNLNTQSAFKYGSLAIL